VGAVHDGDSRRRHGQQRWLAELRPRVFYDITNPTWFVPTGLQRNGDSVSLTFKRWWVVVLWLDQEDE
jgi:hypothetical protein